jgi:hypothetical protein
MKEKLERLAFGRREMHEGENLADYLTQVLAEKDSQITLQQQ